MKLLIMKELLRNLARLYLPVYLYQFDSKKIIYAGYSHIKKNYFTRVLLGNTSRAAFLGRYWFSNIPDLIYSLKADMIFSEISRVTLNHFQNCSGYMLPVWATTRINIERPIDEICHRKVSDFSNVMRRIRKYKLTYEISTDEETYNYFIDRIYMPYITQRYEEEAVIEDSSVIWKSSPPPFLMAVREDGKIVGGSLIRKSGDNYYLMRLGLLDGNEEYRHHGVIGAMYYFSILEGQKMGCRYIDLGGTRPFLTDGLTKFKIGLGAEFVPNLSPSNEYLWLEVNRHSASALEYLGKNPFMYANSEFMLVRYGQSV